MTVLPYNGASGSTGEGASLDRETRLDSSGQTASRQVLVRAHVSLAGPRGITAPEICELTGLDRNSIAPSLTILHGAGDLACLLERRGGCHLYLLPEHVQGRATRPPGRHNAVSERVRRDIGVLLEWLMSDNPEGFPEGEILRLQDFVRGVS